MIELLVAVLILIIAIGVVLAIINWAPFIPEPFKSWALWAVGAIGLIILLLYIARSTGLNLP